MAEAIARDHVRIRIIVENANSNCIENRIGYQILMGGLERNGLSDFLELRYFDGRLHTKSALIDQQLLIVGSQNLHYSLFGEAGFLEFGAATESPQAIQDYQAMFNYYWERAVPAEEAVWGAAAVNKPG
jgi:phosphatidylserine/phosphatidylglycerophosphate/cardiolipin synthase-like enzyme